MRADRLLKPLSAIIIFTVIFALNSGLTAAFWHVDSIGDITITVPGLVLGEEDDPAQALNPLVPASPGRSAQARSRVEIHTQSNQGKTEVKIKAPDRSTGTIKAVPNKDMLDVTLFDDQTQVDLEVGSETEVIRLEESQAKNRISIRSKNNASYVIKNKVAAQSRFPIMVNLETNDLMITTPKGTKTVTVLPDKAVENMLAANVLDQLGGKGGLQWLAYQESLEHDPDATPSADPDHGSYATPSAATETGQDPTAPTDLDQDSLATGSAQPTLITDEAETVVDLIITDDGTLAYEIEGVKHKKFLGFKAVQLERKVIVSAETGALIRVVQDFRTQLLDFFSI